MLADVQALAARGGRIVALGSDPEIKRYIGQGTEAIDLAGMFAMPGFIEGHGHFTGVGQAQLQLNLMKATSWDEIVAMVAAAAKQAKPGSGSTDAAGTRRNGRRCRRRTSKGFRPTSR